jgi:L-lactate dehydrogenase
MKVGIIGVGSVGTSCAKAMLLRGSCHEIVLLDINQRRAAGVASDLSHGEPMCPATKIMTGGYASLADAKIVVISAGRNEIKNDNAVNRDDPRGRLRLLPDNAEIFEQIIPQVVGHAPRAEILVVTDPPDALADVARGLVADEAMRRRIVSAGTFLDTLRFRVEIARRVRCHASSVDALVIGEHGTSQVYLWSSARVGGVPVMESVGQAGKGAESFRKEVEEAVTFANIEIIEGTGASQHGIGIVMARIVEAILRDEGLVAPVGTYHDALRVTLSLPSVIDASGVSRVLSPLLNEREARALDASAAALREALEELPARLRRPGG